MNVVADNYKLIKSYNLDFGTVEIYSKFAIGIIKDGVDLTLENISDLATVADVHFREQDFGYISLRKNSYAINPALYNYIKELSNLKSVAIVSDKEIFKHNFKIEKYFYGKEMALFKNVKSAVEWTIDTIEAN
ncbi:STAS/SEC14 domain-containing protein [Galbibacter mesophilus]|uniref:STAS/SEC14 domain-containing protein n=1 Tax=Galbibacter mesophilus TaxID=379069 RepID=UPI00191F0EFB|nr:STAS/SEC14 domain-containing protein [Galbibacter mesophilus]MCM5663445.1 STAS/SEC14 domain-containing protein [Galbibacter mesophilus]